MANPYSTALRVLLQSARAVDVAYYQQAGQPISLRGIQNQQSAGMAFPGGSHAIGEGSTYVFHIDDIPERPKRGDTMTVAGADLSVLADAKLGAEGISWMVEAG